MATTTKKVQERSYRFFENTKCEYYPCHQGVEELNCLFCYCPMYWLKNCPGKYEMITTKEGKSIKSCMDCTFPHEPENYDKIMAVLAHALSADNTDENKSC